MLLNLVIFLLFHILLLYPIGYLILKRIDADLKHEAFFPISLLISIVVFIFSAFLFGILNLRWLSYPLFVVISSLSFYEYKKEIFTNIRNTFKDKLLLVFIIIAIIVQGIINFPSGYRYEDGYRFWSSQGNDGLWHIALMEEIKKDLPVNSPIYAGEKLYNYHYLVDVYMGETARLLPMISSLDLYFRFFPLIFSLLISISAFSLIKIITNDKISGYLSIFFTSLAGNFGFIITFIRDKQLFAGETTLWAAQGNTILGNPPHALAYSIFSASILLIYLFLVSGKKNYLIALTILAVFMGGIKVSAGLIFVTGILLAGIYDLLINKRKSLFYTAIAVSATNALTIMLMSKNTSSFLIFEPWWFVRTAIVDSGRIGWIDLELRRQHYLWVGRWTSYLRVIELELVAFTVFIVGNLGIRTIGLIPLTKHLKTVIYGKNIDKTFSIFLFGMLFTALAIILLFVQKGIAYNLIQFFQYFILLLGFLAAIEVGYILKTNKSPLVRLILVVFVVLLSLPTVIGNIVGFYGKGKTALSIISNSEITALEFLKNNSDINSLILSQTFNKNEKYKYKELPLPIYAWYSTPYISAIAARKTFLSNEDQVDIIGQPVDERRNQVNKFFKQEDANWSVSFLKDNGIDYVYYIKSADGEPIASVHNLSNVFENDEVIIYKVN